MLKLMDFAHCDEPTEKRPVVRTCDGFEPMGEPCGSAHDLVEFVYADGRKRQFCKLHHYGEALWEGAT